MGWILDLVKPLSVWLWQMLRRRPGARSAKQRQILAAMAQTDELLLVRHDAGSFIQAGAEMFESGDPEFSEYLAALEGLVECGYLARAGFDGGAEVFHLTARGLAAANQFLAESKDNAVQGDG